LRKSVAVLALVLVASLGIIVPSVAAANADPKVVIIVGATQGATAGYRADADQAYAEAIKYTSNVVKVYSPNATWSNVKAAVAGASVVIYLGHGNGWPSPYTYDPTYSTKDGFGLNATAGAGDSNNKYYGEPSIATLDLAPGALVILNHLCYASGNSEPGNPEPTITVARQRADNYASAFLKAGAAAVIADGHAGSEIYLHGLFTTHQSILDMWRTAPDQNGHVVSFASSRSPGATVYQDPMTPTTGFYRSLTVGTSGVTTDEVVSAGYGDTATDPTSLLVPGNASVSTGGAGLYSGPDTTTAPAATLPAGTRLRLVDEPIQTTAESTRLVEVTGIDDPTISGFIAATSLIPRDSTAPVVRSLDSGGSFSPNGDGQVDQTTILGRFTESVAWTLRVRDAASHVLFQKTGTGSSLAVAWNGIVGGQPVADGTYQVGVTGVDGWGNGPASSTTSLTVDTHAPSAPTLTPGADTTQWFSPNGDGVRDTVALTATTSGAGSLVARVIDSHGTTVQNLFVTGAGTSATLTWNGRAASGAYAPDGTYTIRVAARDAAGNTSPTVDRTVTVVGALRSVLTSSSMFFPNDNDTLAQTTKLSFTLARPMTVTWSLLDASGKTVITRLANSAKAAGTLYWVFDGRKADNTMLPRGHYTSSVTATDGVVSATQSVGFDLEAFAIKPSDATPARGQSITLNVTSAEPLAANPTLYVYQPGVVAWILHLTKTGTYTYRSIITLKTTGSTGTVSFMVWGRDTKGGSQATTKAFPLH
jgi:flagellar hook assembly protein FlgD